MAHRPGQVFTRDVLLQQVWDYEFLGDSRLVDVAVQQLRAKIEDDPAEPTGRPPRSATSGRYALTSL